MTPRESATSADFPLALWIDTTARAVSSGNARHQWRAQDRILAWGGLNLSPAGERSSTFPNGSDETLSTIEKVRDSLGEWIAIARKQRIGRDSYLCFADSFGYGTVFYGLLPGSGVFLSTSYEAVHDALRRRGMTPQLNTEKYLEVIADDRLYLPYDGQNTISHEVKLLPAHQALEITPSEVRAVPRSILGGSHAILDVSEALKEGLRSSSATVRAVVGSHQSVSLPETCSADAQQLLLSMAQSASVSVKDSDPQGAQEGSQQDFSDALKHHLTTIPIRISPCPRLTRWMISTT